MKTRWIIVLVKICHSILKIFKRGGSLPGRIALKMDRNILKKLKYDAEIILISGTNGKTTTSNMLYEVMKKKYHQVLCNKKGDNLLEGVATLLLANTYLNLKVKADAIVIEVDELNVAYVMEQVNVNHVIINNFFRDQLDRAGEMENVIARVEQALINYPNNLYLNANDPNVVRLSIVAKQAQLFYFGVAKNEVSKQVSKEASEGKYCPRCQHVLKFDYYHYSHIGKFRCPSCHFGENALYIEATNVDLERHCFMVEEFLFHLPQDALYAVYNCIAVISVAKNLHIPFESINTVFKTFSLKDGRMESFDIGRPCLLNLVKNPTGANEVMKYIIRDNADKDILIVLNDNAQDGIDISWIWDAHFEMLCKTSTKHIICCGTRAYDMALRIKYEDYQGSLEVIENVDEAANKLKTYPHNAYVIATYTALQTTRLALRRISL